MTSVGEPGLDVGVTGGVPSTLSAPGLGFSTKPPASRPGHMGGVNGIAVLVASSNVLPKLSCSHLM